VGGWHDISSIFSYAALGSFPLRASAHLAGVNSGIILLVAAGRRVMTSRR
jgi:hypothetical protein